ncbi:MFS transporter [Liquorilactobacillus nagelii]|uniref:MFS transporter n=1 Tax=Liquorilactobacillus nagelii TaxID=82688 RepID=UPI00071042FC|nr:glycoside-pentoside-hexuronide (GPH):cation symporter [Liquorilactobacillus nagelii]QYH55285.1 MFS transporter [Liquorilactobacillus nagelii DSM 13675]
MKETAKAGFFHKKDLGVDSQGIQKTMRFSDYFADGSGQLVLNIISGLVGQITYFYTDKIGVAAGAVATVLFIAKIVDAFAQLVMGHIMDKGKSKKGICRPWFLRMAIPAMFVTILLFYVPQSFNETGKLGYMLLTNILLTAVIYTAIAIPYTSIMFLRTKSQEERSIMGTWRAALGYIAGSFISMLVIPITNLLGGTAAAWLKLAIILGVIEFLCLIFLYRHSRENSDVNSTVVAAKNVDEHVSLGEGAKILFKNKYWIIMLIVQFCFQTTYGISGASGAYYAKWVLGSDNYVALMGLAGLIPTILGFFIISPMVKKFGVTKTMKISAWVVLISNAIRVFMPSSLIATLVFGATATLGTVPPMALISVMTNNCVDYNEWKTGKRLLGMTNSATGFGGQVGSGLGASVIGWLLALGAYNDAAATQPTSAIYAIYSFSIYIPIIIQVIILLCLSRYDLESKMGVIVKDLKERKNKAK